MRIAETRIETVQYVMPEHANPLGKLFGGKMMHWMTTAGTLAASRLARGPVVLGSLDEIDFLSPVGVGEVALLSAQVEWSGRSSMELSVQVESENPETGERQATTRAFMAYVAIGPTGRPRNLPVRVDPAGAEEEGLHEEAQARKRARIRRIAERRARAVAPEAEGGRELRHGVESWRIVFPENAVHAGILFAGDLMMDIDEVGGILAHRYARSTVVTAAIDAMDFFHAVRVGHLLTLRAGLNLVGRTSMEVGVQVRAENALTGRTCHTCSAYLTFVALDEGGRPRPVPAFEPLTEEECRRWKAAAARRELRLRTRRRGAADASGVPAEEREHGAA